MGDLVSPPKFNYFSNLYFQDYRHKKLQSEFNKCQIDEGNYPHKFDHATSWNRILRNKLGKFFKIDPHAIKQ